MDNEFVITSVEEYCPLTGQSPCSWMTKQLEETRRERDQLKATIDAVRAELAWLKETLMQPNPPGLNPSDVIEHIEWALNDPERTLRIYRMEGVYKQ